MDSSTNRHPARVRRSVLTVPADNPRALAKLANLACDAVIYDLEDAVAPENKAAARAALVAHLDALSPDRHAGPDRQTGKDPIERIVRINALSAGEQGPANPGLADLEAVLPFAPDAILLPKVENPGDVQQVADHLEEADVPATVRLWAMIETPRGLLNVAAIAAAGRTSGGRLDCLVPGLNDLAKATGVLPQPGRPYLVPYLMQVLLAARAFGLDAIDAVFNAISDGAGFAEECRQARAMGFDGKMLIHPAQIAPANAAFGIDPADLARARAIIAAFAEPDQAGKGVIRLDGEMVELLHLAQAERLVARAAHLAARDATTI
ncbi:CoA ester lyase [Rhizobium rhizosphaerae]|uniref:CoA ester lyase n=1 Tax=Xaviernesmea rhizosphaerae TaxID=1672749 RepID=A0ABX3PCE9_9HYPH|nr:CoA ester lyase [Xaviernesmea rhizosphaerae]OQP86120.1 CoA ester lyase [Xaviernesmea rhizosphaerae]